MWVTTLPFEIDWRERLRDSGSSAAAFVSLITISAGAGCPADPLFTLNGGSTAFGGANAAERHTGELPLQLCHLCLRFRNAAGHAERTCAREYSWSRPYRAGKPLDRGLIVAQVQVRNPCDRVPQPHCGSRGLSRMARSAHEGDQPNHGQLAPVRPRCAPGRGPDDCERRYRRHRLVDGIPDKSVAAPRKGAYPVPAASGRRRHGCARRFNN
jgi:hypothetical protein